MGFTEVYISRTCFPDGGKENGSYVFHCLHLLTVDMVDKLENVFYVSTNNIIRECSTDEYFRLGLGPNHKCVQIYLSL